MNRTILIAVAGLVVLGLCIGIFFAPRNSAPEAVPTSPTNSTVSPTKRALLVGVTKYDRHRSFELHGSGNDVDLTRRTLIDLYGFSTENVVCLTEAEGKPELRPTRANIEREFALLAQQAREGDQVFILLAGHGSQQPQPENTEAPEPDGLDEVFLPADIDASVEKLDHITNAIIDDEIGAWLSAIAAKKAYVWAVFDCCHSGNITRGTEFSREIRADELISAAALQKTREEAAARRATQPRKPALPNATFNSQYVVALSACASHETTPECPQPEDDKNNPKYGLLTYTLNSILRTSASSGMPLTYGELVKRIQIKYAERLKEHPTPNMEGKNLSRFLFDTKEVARPPYTIARGKTDWIVNAGDLHGIAAGSILAVYGQAGELNSQTILGYAKVIQSRPLDSVVSSVEYGGMKALAELPLAGRCEVAYSDFALRTLKVALRSEVDGMGRPTTDAEAMRRTAVAGLETRSQQRTGNSPFKVVSIAEYPDVIVECSARGGELIDGSGSTDPIRVGAVSIDALADHLTRLHRARNLLAVAARLQDQQFGRRSTVDLSFEMVRIREGKEELLKDETDALFHPGDRAAFRITNLSPAKPIHACVLIVRRNGEIVPFYPMQGELPKPIKAGEPFTTPSGRFGDDSPDGLEHAVVIAVPENEPPINFGLLAQPSSGDRGFDDEKAPLAKLLEIAMDRHGTRAGLKSAEVKHQAMDVFPYRIVAPPKK